jgi:hypothetical protein
MDMENNLKGLTMGGASISQIQAAIRAAADRGGLSVLDELDNPSERGLLIPSDLQGY